METSAIEYGRPGPLTTLLAAQLPLADGLPDDPVGICAAVHDLVLHPMQAPAAGVPETRLAEQSIRPASDVIAALAALDPTPLRQPRTPSHRVVGTCRTFATLSCALLRLRGIPARARCGFGSYFEPGRHLDHWITEYRHAGQRRWVRIDAQWLGDPVPASTADLADGEFLTGGEAWSAYRAGGVDGDLFGVGGTGNWGPAEIRGNAIRDLAALCAVETLPWDEWGRMAASYAGETGPEYDRLLDTVAATCAADDPAAIRRLYDSEDLTVPAELIR